MQIGRLALITGAALLLILATYTVSLRSGAAGEGGKHLFANLFSSPEDNLEQRVEQLEAALDNANRIQSDLLELVEDLHRRLDHYAPAPPDAEEHSEASATASALQVRKEDYLSGQERYQQQRQMQLQRLIDAGLNPERAEFILERQERFQYEQMQLSYEYRHLKDKSSAEAEALREQLSIYSHPRKMLEHELSEQEFELYMQASGNRQEMRVNKVINDTPAANAGLRPGDKIISYNGERIYHMGDLRTQIYRVAPGRMVAVEVQRAGSASREVIYVPSGPLGIQG